MSVQAQIEVREDVNRLFRLANKAQLLAAIMTFCGNHYSRDNTGGCAAAARALGVSKEAVRARIRRLIQRLD